VKEKKVFVIQKLHDLIGKTGNFEIPLKTSFVFHVKCIFSGMTLSTIGIKLATITLTYKYFNNTLLNS